MLRLQALDIVESKEQLALIPDGKVLINTVYAYSYVVAQRDDLFAQALVNCDRMLYRLLIEPRRMWRRYLIGNPLFLWNIMREKFNGDR